MAPTRANKMLADGRRWRKVESPKPWKPKEAGETLTGDFLGYQRKGTVDDPYQVALIKTDEMVRYVSGTVVESLFMAAGIVAGEVVTVRLVFQGWKKGKSGRDYKDFDLYIAEIVR